MKFLYFFVVIVVMMGCNHRRDMVENLDIEGHRGCRGLFPENTIPAFTHALELGVTTLEMDLVITKDSQVVVSHEPFYNHQISTPPDGIEITEENEKSFNIYKMTYAQTQQWDVGIREHPRFPLQKKMEVHKPLLADVIMMAEEYCNQNKRPLPLYNVEIKSRPDWDNQYHPEIDEYVDLVMAVIQDHDITTRTIIQSFDIRSLQYLHHNYPEIQSAFLIENIKPIETNISELGFTPTIYSPNYKLINDQTLAYCKDKNILLIPWTINDANTMGRLIRRGVDGIITDYPDILIALYEKLRSDASD